MTDLIQAIFVTPGLAFARLGGSSTPQCAYDWIDTRAPRADGETTIAPNWTLTVQPDGSALPFMPDSVAFRDGDLIRPVAPFYEVWARVGDAGSDPAIQTFGMSQYTKGSDAIDRHSKMMDLSQKVEDQSRQPQQKWYWLSAAKPK